MWTGGTELKLVGTSALLITSPAMNSYAHDEQLCGGIGFILFYDIPRGNIREPAVKYCVWRLIKRYFSTTIPTFIRFKILPKESITLSRSEFKLRYIFLFAMDP